MNTRSITIVTASGTKLPNEVPPPFSSEDQLTHDNYINKTLRYGLPAIQWSMAAAEYNCFGMALANRWTLIDDWKIVNQVLGEEYKTVQEEDVAPGDLAAYRDIEGEIHHLGVVSRLEPLDNGTLSVRGTGGVVFLLSKWGKGGEYEHPIKYCPIKFMNELDVEFWRPHAREHIHTTS